MLTRAGHECNLSNMLMMRPNCECCDRDLPPESCDAMICSFECTFCRVCAHDVLGSVCPNCGGGFSSRPPRLGAVLARNPASSVRIIKADGCFA